MRTHKTQQLEVNNIGKPKIEELPENEREIFYATLLKRIAELSAKGGVNEYEPHKSESLL